MDKRVKIFNQSFDNVNTYKALKICDNFIISKKNHIISGKNVYLVVECSRNKFMYSFFESVDLVTVDGRPLVYISRLFLKKPFLEMVGGPHLWEAMVGHISIKGYSLYILGATQPVVTKAISILKDKYSNLVICGYRNGFFKENEIHQIINEIKLIRPDVIFLGLPSPMKENFALKLKAKNIPCLVVLVGGMIDVLAEDKKLAPSWMSMLCLEWFYRLLQEPKRLCYRYLSSNAKFLLLLIREFLKNSKNNID